MVSLDSLDSTLKKSLYVKVGGRRGLPSHVCSEDRQSELEGFHSKVRYPPKETRESHNVVAAGVKRFDPFS